MSAPLNLAIAALAVAVSACGTGPRVGKLDVPPPGPRTAQEMVTNWDANRQAETRCTYEQAGDQLGVDGKKQTKTVRPACGDYKP